jgi:hypothetical protein
MTGPFELLAVLHMHNQNRSAVTPRACENVATWRKPAGIFHYVITSVAAVITKLATRSGCRAAWNRFSGFPEFRKNGNPYI